MSDAEVPTIEEIQTMTADEAMIAGAAVDGVTIVHRRDRFPVRGTKAEKRQERLVSSLFLLSGLAGVAFVVVFVAVPFHYEGPFTAQNYRFYTPLLGSLLAVMLVLMGIGSVLWAKWLMPEEEAVQDRHQEPSTEQDKLLTAATLSSGLNDTGLPRRSMLLRSLVVAGGAVATVPLVALVGAMIKKPGDQLHYTAYRQDPAEFPNGVPIVYSDGRRVSPNDLDPGGIATVFPGVPGAIKLASSPTLIIRLRPGQRVHARTGQESDNFGDYVAFSKICTHAGCPASLYEQQTTRLLCPCHQSQFEVLQDAKPVFGPATRPLPRLPLGVEIIDGRQYFVAKSDFREPIGPGYWERKA
ncbi:menaquinol-cytochrome c reductase iron-sulfur subunit precursor [Jatrophihabitans sp. GAS493]|uniref:cytochrome bc1 complex Rieske iron-sulfur subunit n=1 Tax=Jatrophihabitans sp. GAS493 TaxID=1907575 RepID=UPI000BB79D95|nr:Rieske 2Fe-2S domain-containing protein [Jatrophihabitans sp. GAS493]SOD74391.1 menaquinol-cytochrome c reductase iron-sulfur subunit precursor [Jatrophihabitans sp. GAS493]